MMGWGALVMGWGGTSARDGGALVQGMGGH